MSEELEQAPVEETVATESAPVEAPAAEQATEVPTEQGVETHTEQAA